MNLLASVDKLTNMMKNVVHLEEKAKITKEEASTAGQNTLSKVEDLRQMLLRAKETNNMVFFNFPLLLFYISCPLFCQFRLLPVQNGKYRITSPPPTSL